MQNKPAIQKVGTGRSVEEYQAYGGFVNGEWSGNGHTDEVNVWIGVDESGECYIGVAGRRRHPLLHDGRLSAHLP